MSRERPRRGRRLSLLALLVGVAVLGIFATYSVELLTRPGKVAGSVTLTGKPPPPRGPFRASPGRALYQSVPVGSEGELEGVVLWLSEGVSGSDYAVPTAPATLAYGDLRIEPRVLALRAGQPLEVANRSTRIHNFHTRGKTNRDVNRAIVPGGSFQHVFRRAEGTPVLILCDLHPANLAHVAVFDHPWFAVTGKDGTFELPPVPPGKYRLTAWHETLGVEERSIRVWGGRELLLDFQLRNTPGK